MHEKTASKLDTLSGALHFIIDKIMNNTKLKLTVKINTYSKLKVTNDYTTCIYYNLITFILYLMASLNYVHRGKITGRAESVLFYNLLNNEGGSHIVRLNTNLNN